MTRAQEEPARGGRLLEDQRLVVLDARLEDLALTSAESLLSEALNGSEPAREREIEYVDESGETRTLTMSTVHVPDRVGDVPREMVVVRDVTSELELRNELSTFAGVVAHDLRSPLAAIDGWTEMIADELALGEVNPERLHDFIGRVRTSSHRMRSLIASLLSHATSNHRGLKPAHVDLEAMVTEIVSVRGVGACVTWGPLPSVLADPLLVHQVLDNLIGNALTYVVPGSLPNVQLAGRVTEAGQVAVAVSDRGIGIPEGEHEAVFEEFHRAHQDYPGSGLGLAICRRIVLRHGGTIVARHNPLGVGSVFEFTLPAG